MFEVGGIPNDLAQEALRLAARKLPIRTQVITRLDLDVEQES